MRITVQTNGADSVELIQKNQGERYRAAADKGQSIGTGQVKGFDLGTDQSLIAGIEAKNLKRVPGISSRQNFPGQGVFVRSKNVV